MKLKSILLTAVATLGLTATPMAQYMPNYVPTNALLAWYSFTGNANDLSGNSHNGTNYGATLTTDRFGNTNSAFSFNGTSNYIDVSDVASLRLNSTDFTISFWTNINAYSTGGGTAFIYKRSSGSQNGWGLGADQGTQNKLMLVTSENTDPRGYATTTLALSTWNNVTVVYTLTSQEIKFYIDGVLDNTTTGVDNNYNPVGGMPSPNANCTSVMRFGQDTKNNSYWLNGKLDDIGIWNRALTPDEITALFTAYSTNNNETSNTTANVPGAISYQAVARDAQGAPLADTSVQVRFTLIADSLSGSEEYVETHTLSTNSLGLFTTAFGAGTPVSNTFGNINWSAGNKYFNVQIDTGNGLVDMGTQQLLSTPYSLYSAKAGEIKNPGLPVYSDNAAALASGLVAGDMYRTSTGDLKIVY
jgi:hypothetical protein